MTIGKAVALAFVAALIPASLAAQVTAAPDWYDRPHPMSITRTIAFPDCCPRPDWWDEVEIDRVIRTPDELLAIWQDKGLTDRQKAKALFRAIEDHHRSNPDVAAPALAYYYWVDRKYPHMRRLYELGAAAYIDFDRSLENYGGKTGDLSAGMINRLAQIYLREGEPARAEMLLDYMIKVRGHEINDHMLEWASIHLGAALRDMDRPEAAIATLVGAAAAYDGDWEERIEEELAEIRDQMGWRYYLNDTRLTYPVAAIVAVILFLVLLRMAFRDRSRRPN